MFDVGFTEVLLIGIIALLVLGPERLPHAARMTGAFLGKIRRSFTDIKSEIEREVAAEELRARIRKEIEESGLDDIKKQVEGIKSGDFGEYGETVRQELEKAGLNDLKEELEETEKSLNQPTEEELAEATSVPSKDDLPDASELNLEIDPEKANTSSSQRS